MSIRVIGRANGPCKCSSVSC